ncbi:hypothetical protein LguiA_004013 [Lonicera macranthoides]
MASTLEFYSPVGTGFSYATTSRASQSTDLQMCDQAYQFLQKILQSIHIVKLIHFFQTDGRRLSYYWMNDKSVQTALHIREGSMKIWERCNHNLPYIGNILDSRQYHVNLSKKGYRSLVYSGDHDMVVPFLSTQAWIRNLNYSIIDDWRSWNVKGQIAGEEGTQLQSISLQNVMPCSRGGYLMKLCDHVASLQQLRKIKDAFNRLQFTKGNKNN